MAAANVGEIEKHEALVTPVVLMESTPVVWHGRLHLCIAVRPARWHGSIEDYFLTLIDVATDERVATFGVGFGLSCAYVEGDRLYVYASKWEGGHAWSDIYLLESSDLHHWEESLVVAREPGEALFNSSVCKDGRGYVMAYESNAYTPFTVKFARSDDLRHWEKLTDCDFSRDTYAACPTVRRLDGSYYLFYLVAAPPGYVTYAARSADLKQWEYSPRNPVLTPVTGEGEGINNSDLDLVEFEGRVHLYYATGDQRTWTALKRATFGGTLADFFAYLFPRS